VGLILSGAVEVLAGDFREEGSGLKGSGLRVSKGLPGGDGVEDSSESSESEDEVEGGGELREEELHVVMERLMAEGRRRRRPLYNQQQ
jgi:hypothetical protein